MKINSHNYEAYLIDFMEGNLSSGEVDAVMSFLENHPDIKAEFEGLSGSQLLVENVVFDKKNLLKKNPAKDIEGISKFEQLSIAKLEKDIVADEEKVLAELLENSHQKQYEHQLIQKSRLKPDLRIVFPKKNKLKHYQLTGSKRIIYRVVSVAASVALLVSLFFINADNKNNSGLAILNHSLNKPVLRQAFEKPEVFEIKESKVEYTNLTNNELIDSVSVERINELVVEINAREVNQLEGAYTAAAVTSSELAAISATIFDKNLQEEKVEDYVNATLQKLGISREEKEKSLVVKAGESVLRSAGDFIRKRFQVKKVEIEDGRKLYAVKAGSLEFYTNLKGRKNKNKDSK